MAARQLTVLEPLHGMAAVQWIAFRYMLGVRLIA
jgi:hypothetical protein